MGFFKDFFMGTEGTPAEHGIDTVYYKDYDDYAGIRSGLVDYWQGIMRGEEPEWLTKYSDELLQGTLSDINRDYLGLPGARGSSALGLAQQVDAQMGTGKATTTNRSIQDLMEKRKAARLASAGYRQSFMGDASKAAGQNLLGLEQGPRAYSTGYSIPGTKGSPGWLAESFGSLMSNIGPKGFDKALDFVSGTFGGGGTQFSQGGTIGSDLPTNAFSDYAPQGQASIPTPSGYGGSKFYF